MFLFIQLDDLNVQGIEVQDDNDADDEDNLDTSKEDEDDIENESIRLPRYEEEEDDEEEIVKIVGKKRKALRRAYDPVVQRRRRLRAYYDRRSYFTFPTSVMLINLVKIRGLTCTSEFMWNAILGATDQFLRSNINEAQYNAICQAIGSEVTNLQRDSRYKIGESSSEITVQGAETGRIEELNEYRFFMYRHWSLYDSMYFSPYVASKLACWKSQGNAKLQELLARIGLPLQQCKESYNFMRPDLRSTFRTLITGIVLLP